MVDASLVLEALASCQRADGFLYATYSFIDSAHEPSVLRMNERPALVGVAAESRGRHEASHPGRRFAA